MAKIGELLIAEGHLTQDGLEEALDWQVLYGGRLGSNLLELKLVEEADLARALGRQLGAEVAWGELVPDAALIGAIPKHIADRHEMVPWKVEKRRLKIICTEIKVAQLDELGYRLGRTCSPVLAPEFRVFQALRAHYQAQRQMRALDFGIVPVEGREERRRKKEKQQKGAVAEAAPELIDEAAFHDLYNQVVAGRSAKAEPAASWAPPPAQALPPGLQRAEAPEELIETLPDDAILEELPADAIVGEAASEPVAAADAVAGPPLRTFAWDEPAPQVPARDEEPLEFAQALRLLEGVTDRDSIAHIVLRASRSKAARALLLHVQGGVALGWDGIGEGLSGGAANSVAIPLSAPSAFQLVVNTRSHYLGPLQKTPLNIRFLAALGKKVPLSSMLLPILHRGRVSHLLYLDNGHRQQAPTDVGEMLILSQRIAQTVDALVERKRKAARG